MKSKRVALTIVAIVLAMTSLFAFVACDEDGENCDENNGGLLMFDEGTTVGDIVAMIDGGEIVNYSVKMIYGNIYDGMRTEYRYEMRVKIEFDAANSKGL